MISIGAISLSGRLELRVEPENFPVPKYLHLEWCDNPLADILQELICGKYVSIRYWISETEDSVDKLTMGNMSGIVEAKWEKTYDEGEGYQFTDEQIMIGGYDLLCNLKSFIGKYLLLEIDIQKQKL